MEFPCTIQAFKIYMLLNGYKFKINDSLPIILKN